MPQVTFQSDDDISIHATLELPKSKHSFPGVILFHGMTSSEASYLPLAARLAEDGIAGLAVTMRGHGNSGGDFNKSTVREAVNDALAAYDFMIQQPGIDPSRLGIMGSSVGAILAILGSVKRDVNRLLLRAPAGYTAAMMDLTMAQTMQNERRQFYEIGPLKDTPAGRAIKKYKGNLLVVTSGSDDIIPLGIPKGYLDLAEQASSKQLAILKEAPHSLTGTKFKEEFEQLAVNYFKAMF